MNSAADKEPQPSSIPGFSDVQEAEIDIRAMLLMLWRRRMVILGTVLIGLSIAVITITLMKSQYTARTLLLIQTESLRNVPSEFQLLAAKTKLDSTVLLSELEVLRSRSLARLVVERLNLMSDPEFNPNAETVKVVTGPGSGRSFKQLALYRDELGALPQEVIDAELARTVTLFLEKLNVRSIPGSQALQVEFTSYDPRKAALIANTVVDAYIEQRLEQKFEAAEKLTGWLDKRLEGLRTQVREAETAVEQYRARHNLAQGNRAVVSAEQLSQLNSQLVLAKTQLAEAEARLEQVENLEDMGIQTTSEVLNSELVRRLKLDEVSLERKLSELSSRYGEKHPVIVKTRNELEQIRRIIFTEMDKIRRSIESEVLFAKARTKALEEGLRQVTGQLNEDNEAMIRLRELEQEASSSRIILDTFLNAYKRSDAREELEEAEARVISYAVAPSKPTYPNRMLILSLALAVSLFIGIAIAILIEKLDNTFRSANQLERYLGFPCFALIPNLENMTQPELADYIISRPSSTVAEAVRTLRMVLNLRSSSPDKKPKVITVTSSFPGEGKTMLSAWLSRLTAKSGEKVIVVDCDLRRSNIHRTLKRDNDLTLVEYLTGQNELDEIIQKDEQTGLHIINGRSVPNSALDLISSKKMEQLIEGLSETYDLVIIDSPACLAVSDARVLAKLSDQTLYIVAWDRTPREVVMSGVKQFSDMNYNDMAFVLTKVDVRRHVRYGYGDTVYYYGRYKEYYSD